jgi:DNA-binding transcriptional ArsR family regulator
MTRFDLLSIIDLLVPSDFQSTTISSTKPKASTAKGGEYPRLDVDRYLSHYGIEAKQREKGASVVWRLDCPFNPDHKRDAQLQQEASGRMGFACPHNSCQGRNWQDFREMFDPTDFFERTGGPRTSKRQREYSGLPGLDPGASTIDAPGHRHDERSQPESEAEKTQRLDAQEKARRAQRVKSLGENAKQRLRQGIDTERILLELKGQRDQWNDPAISDEVIEKVLTAEIQAFMPKTLNGEELMRTQFPEPKWVLSGFIGEGITVLAGRPKMGKSALALNVGVAVAHGGIALDIPCEEGDVLYCSGITEGSFPEFQDRLKNLMPNEPVSPRIHFMEDLARLDDGGEAQLRLWLQDHPDARLVVLDTLQSFAPRQKRNADAYAEGYDAMSILQRIYRDFNVSILVITHTRKSLRGTASDWALDEVLGSTSITGASNASLVLRKSQNGFEFCTFGRRIKNEEYAVTFDGERGLWTLLGEVERHNVSDERKAILSLLEEMKGEPLSAGDIAQILKKSAGSVKYLLIKLTQEGVVSRAQRGKYVIPTTNATITTVATNATNATNSTLSPNGSDGSANGRGDSTAPTIHNHTPGTASVAIGSDGSDGSGDSTINPNGSDTNHSEKVLPFLTAWQSAFGTQMVYPSKLIPLAYDAGFDMDAHGWGHDTHIRRILRDLTDKPVDGLTVRCIDGDAYQLEGQPAPPAAEKVSDDIPKAHVDFIRAWYHKCGNQPAYTTTLLQIAKRCFPVKMGLSVSDQMKRAIEALEGKTVCGLSIVKDDDGYHLEGTLEGGGELL